MSTPREKRLIVEITYSNEEDLRRALSRVGYMRFTVGDIYVKEGSAVCTGHSKFVVPLQEPCEEFVNGERRIIFKSNF